jgi:hypothetical protein
VIPRRVAFLAVAALLLAGAGVAAAVTHDDDDAVETAAVTTTTSVPETTTTVETTTVPPTTVAAAATTTTTPGAATTTTARATTTTTRRPASTTTTAPSNPDCTAAQVAVTATTDKTVYGVGQQVMVVSTLRNRSSTTCFYAGHTLRVTILDPAGRSIIFFDLVTPGPAKSAFVPGATLTGTVTWDQRACQTQPCPQPPPGPYSAQVRWIFPGGPYEARAAFNLV